jgi:hypothetical protein
MYYKPCRLWSKVVMSVGEQGFEPRFFDFQVDSSILT